MLVHMCGRECGCGCMGGVRLRDWEYRHRLRPQAAGIAKGRAGDCTPRQSGRLYPKAAGAAWLLLGRDDQLGAQVSILDQLVLQCGACRGVALRKARSHRVDLRVPPCLDPLPLWSQICSALLDLHATKYI